MKKLIYLIINLSSLISYGQEICNNGIDDNGDGLVDCYDPQCSTDSTCSYFFYGKPAISCSSTPANPVFNLNNIWQSTVNVSTRSTMFVGDVDGDGVPEVACHQDGVNQLYILDGQTGNLEVTINCPAILDYADAITIGDTDDDGLGEIYVITSDALLRCFENDGTAKAGFIPPNIGTTAETLLAIADFNYDGIPEIYIGNKIYNSLTGALIASGTGSIGNNPGSNGAPSSMPVAADVLPDAYCIDCAGLELICGNTVYAVNIPAGTITAIANGLPGILNDGFTSVADMNLDGQSDVIVTSNGTIYVWDPRTGLQMGNTFNIPNTGAGGRANIADYDNDGLPEIGAGGMNRYVVIDIDTASYTLSQKWIKTIVDGSEHTTGSVFDFDCDGAAEVVYRDENNLYVWDGATGNLKASTQCGSATRSELPTIVDVDGDGQVNIVCACAAGNQGSAGKVKAFNSSSNQWVSSRKVMNQHTYYVVNINDDLSIPVQQQDPALLPKLNGFLMQSPVYDVNWNSTCIPLADMNVSIDSVIYCQKPDSVIIVLTLCNMGSKITTPPVNVSVYNGNPLSGGTLIAVYPLASSISPGFCSNDTISVPFSGTSATFYVYVNDDGSNPANAPVMTFNECDSLNNGDSVTVNPLPSASFTSNNNCLYDTSFFNNTSSGNIATWEWNFGDSASSSAASPSHIYPAAGTYSVTLIVVSDSGCSDTTINIIEKYPVPIADFSPTTVCLNDSTQFTDMSTISGGNIVGWAWNFGDGTPIATQQNPYHLFALGNYNVSLIAISDKGCFDDSTKQVGVYPLPDAVFSYNNGCINEQPTVFSDSSFVQSGAVTGWQWDFGDGSPQVQSQNPTHVYAADGSYNVQLLVTTNNGCTDSTVITIEIYPLPTAGFSNTTVCRKFNTEFTNESAVSSGFIASWQWDFGNGTFSALQNPSIVYAAGGDYPVTLTVVSNNECTDVYTGTVTVYTEPVADFIFIPQRTTVLNTMFTFLDNSAGPVSQWNWTFYAPDNTVLGNDTAQNPLFLFPQDTGSYPVNLKVTTANGCVNDITLYIDIENDFTLFIPAAFTPNDDGLNEVFFPAGIELKGKDFEMLIYDRWGDLIYQTIDVDKPWDGRANNGKDIAQQDVYIWLILTRDVKGMRHRYIGHVSLLR